MARGIMVNYDSARICERNVDAFTNMEAMAGFVGNHGHVQRRLDSLQEDPP